MLYFYCKKCTLTELHYKPKGDVIMKRLTAVLLSLIFCSSNWCNGFCGVWHLQNWSIFWNRDPETDWQYAGAGSGKEKAEELVETSRTSSYDFTQVEAYVNQHVAQQSSEMFRLIEAAEQKARDVSPEPIIPDTCKHNYDLDKVVREEFRNMPIGRDFYQGDLLLCLYQVWRYKNRSGNLWCIRRLWEGFDSWSAVVRQRIRQNFTKPLA